MRSIDIRLIICSLNGCHHEWRVMSNGAIDTRHWIRTLDREDRDIGSSSPLTEQAHHQNRAIGQSDHAIILQCVDKEMVVLRHIIYSLQVNEILLSIKQF